jgi:hypothetical protein
MSFSHNYTLGLLEPCEPSRTSAGVGGAAVELVDRVRALAIDLCDLMRDRLHAILGVGEFRFDVVFLFEQVAELVGRQRWTPISSTESQSVKIPTDRVRPNHLRYWPGHD